MPLDVPTNEELLLRNAATDAQAADNPASDARPSGPVTAPGEAVLPGNISAPEGIGPAVPLDNGDDAFTLVPAMDEQGRVLSRQQAAERYAVTGENYGLFETEQRAREFQEQHTSPGAREKMRAALLLSRGISPDEIARDKAIAKRLGIPFGAVRYNRAGAQDETDARQIEQYEGLVDYASRSEAHAAIVRGDAGPLSHVAMEVAAYDAANTTTAIRARNRQAIEQAGISGEVRATRPFLSTEGQSEAWRKGDVQRRMAALGNRWAAGEDIEAEEKALAEEQALLEQQGKVATTALLDKLPGLNAAIEQGPTNIPIMLKSTTAALMAATGAFLLGGAETAATGGLAAPAVPPQVWAAARAAYLGITAKETYNVERGAEIMAMRQLRDADGNPLPRDVILAASSIYATLSAATEVGGEAVFLSMLKPLGIGAGAAKPAIKGAVERAAKDKSLWKALLDVGARIGITAGAEGVTEGAQEGQAILAESAAGAAANARGAKFDTSILTPENAKRVQESVEAGIAGGFWQGGGPVIVSGVMQGMSARAARKFADDQNRLHASIERTKTRQRDPEAMGEILEALSPVMQEEVTLPMDAAVELHQQGMDILTPLGISRESAEKAAALGQSVSVKLGSLHTMLDARQFQAAAEIMRRDDAAASAAEYGEADATMDKMLRQALEDGAAAEDVRNGTATLTPEQKAELENVHQDFRSQMAEAIKSVPGLANQVQIQAGMEPYVDALLNLWRRRAVVAARRTGENPADIYRRTALHGAQLLKKQLRRATPEQQIEDDLAAPAETPAAPVISTPEAAAAQPLAPEAPAMQTPEQEEAAAAPAVPVRQAKGADTALVTSTGDTPARFEVWELADLIPSHDPSAQFARRADYPADVQERPYHSDPGEQDKVRRNAAALDPRYLVNTNPDAMSGPPVITADGVVLGGNSRTMSVQMAYGSYPERAQGYKDALATQAAAFGLDPAQVVAMQQPVLVRVVQTPMTRLEMAQASRRYNEVTTQALQAEAEGVSKSKLLTAETMAALAERMQEYGTLREFFDAAPSREFVQRLMDDGVIERTQASRLTESDGRLNAEGKTLAENALRGVIVQDYDVIRNAPDSALNKIDRAIPYLAQLKARGEGWDMSGVVTEALRILGTAKNENQDVAVFLGQGSLLQSREAVRPAVQAMALTLDRATQKEVALRFACMAHDAQQRNKGQGLLGVAEDANTPAKSFINAFLRTVAAVGGVPVTEYNPAKNARHAAIAYAWKNGGRGHTVAEALNRIVKAVTDKKAAKDVREQAREIQGQLAGMDGSVIVQEPKLGSFFSYKPGQTLFQFIGQQGAAALDAAEEVALRMDNLAVARDMESAGKDAKAILYATGWQRGADMKWRYELDDSGIRFSKSADMLRVGQNKEYARYKELADNINNLSEQEWQEYSNLDDTWGELERREQNNFMEHGAKLEEVIEAPELFKAYPELRDVHVIFMRPSTMEGYLGLWNRVGKTIKLNKKLLDSAVGQENKIKNVLLHEIQHAIQDEEGFERGGNAALFEDVVSEFNDEIKFLRNNLAQLEKWSGIKDFVSESMRAVVAGEKKFADHWRDLDEFKKTNPDYLDNVDAIKRVEKEISDAIDVFKAEHGNAMTADEMYRHLMGEVEARNTSARMNMTAAERLASLATETEDVAREDQILLNGSLRDSGSAASLDPAGDRLVTLHNLSESALLFADGLGGLAVPSLGVTKAATPYSSFGGITLIGTRGMVDPATTPVFSADAYSARFPRPIWSAVKSAAADATYKELREAFDAMGDLSGLRNVMYYMTDSPSREEAMSYFMRSNGAKAAYLKSKGQEVAPVMRQKPESRPGTRSPEVQAVVKKIQDEDRSFTADDVPAIIDALKAWATRSFTGRKLKNWMGAIEILSPEDARNVYVFTLKDMRDGGGEEVDMYATRDKLRELVGDEDPDFQRFAKEMIADKFGLPKIELGRKKVPMTLDNVVEAMSSANVRGKEKTMTYNTGQVLAAASKRFSSMQEMQDARTRVTSPEKAKALKGDLDERMKEYATELSRHYAFSDTWASMNDAMRTLAEAAKRNGTAANLKAAMRKLDFKDVPGDLVDEGVELLKDIKGLLVSYFEAKPQRAVRLNEFAGAVVPEDISPEARAALERAGLEIREYAGTDGKEQAHATSSLAAELDAQRGDVLFQPAFHGSPYRFDRFSVDHIGTGEGAQAHGWGLYFAQDREVSKKYRLMLTGSEVRTEVNGHTIDPNSRTFALREMAAQAAHIAANEKTKTGENLFPRVVASMREEILRLQRNLEEREESFNEDKRRIKESIEQKNTDANGFVSLNGEKYKSVDDYINDIEHKNMRDRGIIYDNKMVLEKVEGYNVSLVAENPGQVYEVDIPENDVLLDEDKKLNDQPEVVQEALRNLWTKVLGYDAPANKPHDMFSAYDGRRFYGELADRLGSAKAASRALNAAGVKGITYDGRQDGRCFVVFDDKAVKVLETFYQDEDRNAFGVPLSRVTRIEGDVTPADVEAALLELAGRDLPNDIEGITAQVNGNQRRKLNSQPAAKKSMENGFTRSEHRGIAAKIAEAWRWAAEAQRGGDAKSGKPDLTIRRFVSALNVNGRDVFAWITVKDSDKGARIYSVELMQNEKLRDKVGGGAGKMPTADALHRSFDEIIKRLNAPVNGAMPGQRDSLRSGSPAGARGSVTRRGGNYYIDLFKRADLSTLAHEMAHVYFLELERAVSQGVADAQMQDDFAKLRAWVGAAEGRSLTDAQHEQLARGFEAYLMEGKAPTPELEGTFARFRAWLLRIYQTVKALNVQLNDEVRSVFDRMLATQEEIEAAAAENELLNLTTGELESMGVSRVQQEYTRRVLETAKQIAAERLQSKRDAERRSRRADYTRQATEELQGNPRYLAAAAMRATPLDLDAVVDLLGGEQAAAFRKRHPASLKRGGADPTIFAAQHGYESADALLADMQNLPRKADAVRVRVEALDAEYDQQFNATDELFNSGGLQEHASLVARHLSRVAGRAYIQQRAIVRVAAQEMEQQPMREAMRVDRYRANMRRALRDERRAIAAKEFDAAYEANTKARLNLEMARASQELRDSVDAMERRVKRFMASKTVPDTPKYALNILAAQHGVMDENARLAASHTVDDIREWQTKLEADGYALALDPVVMTSTTPWREMSMREFAELLNAFNQIIVTERNQRNLLTAAGKKNLDAVAADLEQSIMEHGTLKREDVFSKKNPAKAALSSFHASHMKIEEICIQLDGGKVGGPCWTYIYKPIADAENNQALRLRDVRDYLKKRLFSMYSPAELSAMGVKKSLVPSIGKSVTMEWRIALALNMGNATNIERIKSAPMVGEGKNKKPLTDEQIADALKPLTRRDWQFVQGVWDYFETFKPESFKLQEEVTGVRPTAVEPQPFTVTTADGQQIEMRGGYYPIAYDRAFSERQFERDQKEMDKELFAGRNYGAAMTRHGHLKERAKGGMGTPLRMELGVIPEHLFNTVHDLAYRKAVLDVAKVLRHGKVRDALVDYAGRDIYRQFMPWLQDCANERQEPMGSLQRAARWARAGSTIMQMGFKVTTMVMQPIGITQTFDVLGYRWTCAGIAKVFGNAWRIGALYRETCARSQFMATRLESYDRDIRDITKSLQTGTVLNWVTTLRNKAFVPMAYFQLSVDLPTWWGAYEKGLKDFHGDESKAAQYADSIVRQAQGSGSTKDLSQIQRYGDLGRLFTMYYSYFNVFYNLLVRHIKELRADHSPAGIFRAANSALLLWFIPSVLSELAAGRGPEEDEEWWKWASRIWFQYPFQAVVGLRDIVNGIASGFDYEITPASATPESIIKATKTIYKALEKGEPSALVKPTVEAIGYGMALPLKQPVITIGNMWDYCTDPSSEFYVRDLFFTKPKGRK